MRVSLSAARAIKDKGRARSAEMARNPSWFVRMECNMNAGSSIPPIEFALHSDWLATTKTRNAFSSLQLLRPFRFFDLSDALVVLSPALQKA